MLKYVYVLVSDETDYYLEQALMSITSLKAQSAGAFVSLLIDETTETTLKNKRKNILGLVDELKTIEIDSRFNKKARSRWLKTTMRRHIDGNFLYIDSDTIISEDLSGIEDLDVNLGAILDSHVLLQDSLWKKSIQKNDKILNFNSSFKTDKYFNGGIILCKDDPVCHNFFNEWHNLWLHCFERGILIDQPSFNQTNHLMDNVIIELDGKWNCQILANGAVRYLHDAKIIHYFAIYTPEDKPYLLANKEIFERIRKSVSIDPELKEMLMNSKNSFMSNTRLVAGKFGDSKIYSAATRIFFSKLGASIELMFLFVHRFIFEPLQKILPK